jgi:CRP-like cAMP-binding protein
MSKLVLRSVDIAPKSELLLGLKKPEIDLILAAARLRRYHASSVMTRQGDKADQLFLLWKGRARYFFETADGKRLILLWIPPGHIFGAATMASTWSRYLVSAEAVRDSIVLVWDRPTIRSLTRRFPQLLMNAYLTTMEYLSWYISTHVALASQTARERLAHVLLGFAPIIGRQVAGGIEFDATNEELADAASVDLYTTSRVISEWHRNGAIRKLRGKIILRSGERLFRAVSKR